MAPCADSYLKSLNACGVTGSTGNADCTWVSSVYGSGSPFTSNTLPNQYWVDNMTQPVLFAPALDLGIFKYGPFSSVLEVGPHPALKSPATETLFSCSKDKPSKQPSYHGTLSRRQDSVVAVSTALGFLWENGLCSTLDFDAYRLAWYGSSYSQPQSVPDLPTYQWDHQHVLLREPRLSKRFLTEPVGAYEFLGTQEPESTDGNLIFRNVIGLRSFHWLRGHQIQGQFILPAMWYAAATLEAARSIRLGTEDMAVEILDFKIAKAVILDENVPTEVVFGMSVREASATRITSRVTCAAGSLYNTSKLDSTFSAELIISYGSPKAKLVPCFDDESKTSLEALDVDDFYDHFKGIGLEYSGAFRRYASVQQATKRSETRAFLEQSDSILHPAILDLALQALLAASVRLGDECTSPLLIPQSIDRILFIAPVAPAEANSAVTFRSVVTEQGYSGMKGDVDIYASANLTVQLQDVVWVPLKALEPVDDRTLFAKTVWESDVCDGAPIKVTEYGRAEQDLVSACDRVLWYYYRQFRSSLTMEQVEEAEWHFKKLWNFIDHVLAKLKEEEFPTVNPEWLHDSHEQIAALIEAHADSADMQLIRAVGMNLPVALVERRPMLEFMMADGKLSRYYQEGLGYDRCYQILHSLISRIAHRYPRMMILEVGAGTGGATQHVLDSLNHRFISYTFTDVSSGFFEKAQEKFSSFAQKMIFKTFDLERDPLTQSYQERSYDLIIGSLVIHTTRRVAQTLAYMRSLLKPGGFLVLVEGSVDTPRSGFMMGGLPGWWLGDNDRKWGPMLSPDQWQALLLQSGFTGIEMLNKDSALPNVNLGYVFLSRAIDPSVKAMRRPLSQNLEPIEQFIVVGGCSVESVRDSISASMRPYFKKQTVVDHIEDVQSTLLSTGAPLLCLFDYDQPVFERLNAAQLGGFQRMVSTAQRIFFVTRADNPYTSIFIGLLRSLRLEIPHLRIQVLIVRDQILNADLIAESFLKLVHFPTPDADVT